MQPIPAHDLDRRAQAAIEGSKTQRDGTALNFGTGKGRPVPRHSEKPA